MDRPRYVSRWPGSGSPQPFVCRNMTGYIFVLRGRLPRLQRLCQRYLTDPSGGRLEYRALSPYVVLTVTRARSISSQDEGYQERGWSPETEAAFWVLTGAVSGEGSERGVEHVAWFVPYMFVDSPTAVTLGREIYGFPKELAWVGVPVAPPGPPETARFTVDAFAIRRFHPDSRLSRLRLLEIAPGPARAARGGKPEPDGAPEGTPSGSLAATFGEVGRLLREGWSGGRGLSRTLGAPTPALLESLGADVAGWKAPVVFLKQYYDPADGTRACYQAIVEAPLRITSLRRGMRLPGGLRLTLFPSESHPLHEDLGLEPEQPVVLGLWDEFDAVLEAGRTVWQAR